MGWRARGAGGELTRRFRKVTHCLFDLDGTLLGSEVMYHKMLKQICERYDRVYTKELQMRMYGVTNREICQTVVRELRLPISPDELERQLDSLATSVLPAAPLQQGAEQLVSHLHSHRVPLALVTNSTETAVRLHVHARPQLFAMFHHKVSISDPEVRRGKPSPDIYLVAAARFPDTPAPNKCLVFEDSPVGVEAAREAGMQVVMVADGRLPRECRRRAALVLRSLLHFRPELFGLPPCTRHNTPRTAH